MGIRTSTSGGGGNYETEVVLNVYDLTPLNNYVAWFGFGIFHSGIEGLGLGSLSLCTYGKIGLEKKVMSKSSKAMTALIKHATKLKVHGMEYGFGAHDFPISGVFEVEPKSCPGFIYRCSVPLGRIDIPPSEFREFVGTVASEYHGDTYHLISKNCNHFTDDMSLRLTGKSIPGWVNRLAKLGAFCNCLLPESLQETTVKQLPEYHSYAEDDGSGSLSTTSPREPIESDDSEKDTKQLLSSTLGTDDVAFIKEVQR